MRVWVSFFFLALTTLIGAPSSTLAQTTSASTQELKQQKRWGRAVALTSRRLATFGTDTAWEHFVSDLYGFNAPRSSNVVFAPPPPVPAPPPPEPPRALQMITSPAPAERAQEQEQVIVTGATLPHGSQNDGSALNPEITNNQNIGVDEGGIVKQIGPYLMVLQDGRIFSVDTRTNMRLADRMNVYTDNDDATWYDEMLVQGDRVIITAYSYEFEATSFIVFRVNLATGKLSRQGVFYVTSDDYYSGENYASRIVGNTLILSVRTSFPFELADLHKVKIGVAGGSRRSPHVVGQPLISARTTHRPVMTSVNYSLHSVVICPLQSSTLRPRSCKTQTFVGPEDSELLVTTTDVYLWNGLAAGEQYNFATRSGRHVNSPPCSSTNSASLADAEKAVVYRVPINGGKPTFAHMRGRPTDQFTMEVQNQTFYMLSKWANDRCVGRPKGSFALASVPLTAFAARPGPFLSARATKLPGPANDEPMVRFSKGWIVYADRGDWDKNEGDDESHSTLLYATPLALPANTVATTIPHMLNRLQPVAGGMLATGSKDGTDLSMSWLSLGTAFRPRSTLTLSGRVESEGRSHAFSVTQLPDGRSLMGLPTTGRNDGTARDVDRTLSSDISFFSLSTTGQLAPSGKINMVKTDPNSAYRCEVSCIDWYGNSRAVFTGGRIFALIGTQIVEGQLTGNEMTLLHHLDMTGPVTLR
jgi:hypothetical protein